ncbi:hypothetical protein AAFX60_020585 [Aliivibrio fischeri]
MGNNTLNNKSEILLHLINFFFDGKVNYDYISNLKIDGRRFYAIENCRVYVLEEFIVNDFKNGHSLTCLTNKYERSESCIRKILYKYGYNIKNEKIKCSNVIDIIHLVDLFNRKGEGINYFNLIHKLSSIVCEESKQKYFLNGDDFLCGIKYLFICDDAKSMTANEIAFKYGHSVVHIYRILKSNNTVSQIRERTPKLN